MLDSKQLKGREEAEGLSEKKRKAASHVKLQCRQQDHNKTHLFGSWHCHHMLQPWVGSGNFADPFVQANIFILLFLKQNCFAYWEAVVFLPNLRRHGHIWKHSDFTCGFYAGCVLLTSFEDENTDFIQRYSIVNVAAEKREHNSTK